MRQIRSFEDAQAAIRELYDLYDLLKSKDIDLNQRRVKNAAPSREPYDYVVRKELDDVVAKTSPPILKKEPFKKEEGEGGGGSSGGGKVSFKEYFNVVFSIIHTPLVTNPSGCAYVVQRKSKLLMVKFIAVVPPVSDFECNFMKNNSQYILRNNILVDENYTSLEILSFDKFNVDTFETDDIITLDVKRSGWIQKVTLELYFST